MASSATPFFCPNVVLPGRYSDQEIRIHGAFALHKDVCFVVSAVLELCWVLSKISMKTFVAKPESVRREWLLVDAQDKVLGRLASEVARRLRGKHKAEYTPHVDTGDYVVVINAEKVHVTGNKTQDKIYHRHTGYPGGIKSVNLETVRNTHPERIIESAVKGMLPKNSLGRSMFSKLRVYAGAEHQHQAQQPKTIEI